MAQAKIEREKIIPFRFESKMKDVGVYARSFRIRRLTPGLTAQIEASKSALMSGRAPTNVTGAILVDVMATCAVMAEPVDTQGKASEPAWMDNVLDNAILMALNDEIEQYQKSFYEADDAAASGTPAAPPV